MFVPELPERRLRVADTARAGPGFGNVQKKITITNTSTNIARALPGDNHFYTFAQQMMAESS